MKLFQSYRYFYPNYFQIFNKMEAFFQNALFVQTENAPLHICFLPISSLCISKKVVKNVKALNFKKCKIMVENILTTRRHPITMVPG